MAAVASGFCLGQLVITQVAAHLALGLGWRATYAALAGLLAVALLPLGRWLRDAPAPAPAAASPDDRPAPGPSAFRTPAFWWLTLGLMGCGFTDFLLTTHLPPLVSDRGLAPTVAANAVSLWAAANAAGILLAGVVAARRGARLALVLTYGCRAAALAGLPLADEPWELYAFAVAFGATFFTTAPLTATVVAELFGPRRHGTVLGMANLFHHLAGALGAFAGGLAFDLTGSYHGILLASAALVVGSMGASLLLPVRRR
jgi:predicted MFS family arabinose efflux permease